MLRTLVMRFNFFDRSCQFGCEEPRLEPQTTTMREEDEFFLFGYDDSENQWMKLTTT